MPTLLAYSLLFTGIAVFFIFIHLMIGKFVRPNRPDAEKQTVYECGEPTIGSSWIQFDLRFYVVALLFVIFDVEMAFFFPWAVVFGKSNQLAGDAITMEQRAENVKLLDPKFAETHGDQLKLMVDEKRFAEERRIQMEELEKQRPQIQKEIEKLDADLATKRTALKEVQNKLTPLAADDPQRTALDDERIGLESTIFQFESQRKRKIESLTMEKATSRDALVKRTQTVSSQFAWIAFLDILVFFGVLLVGFAYLWRRGDLNWVRSTAAQEVAPQRTEDRGQRTEDRGQRTEDRGQKTEFADASP